MEKRITIEPVTRLEGHAKIEIFLDEEGNVDDAFFDITELRGFEEFCKGRPLEEMPRITTRICGVCPWAHHMASCKALDKMFSVDPPETAKKLRELGYNAFMFHDHLVHIYALGWPDLIVGLDAPPSKRNLFGVLEVLKGKDPIYIKKLIKARASAQRITEIIGGKTIHPVTCLPGGLSKGIIEEERKEIENLSKVLLDFANITLKIFKKDIVDKYVDLFKGDTYWQNTYYMGMVDENNKVNFYDGKIKIVGPSGKEFAKFDGAEYLDYIAERVNPWSYPKFPYLKKVGWKGLVDGKDSGVYRVGPLARLNVADGLATPLAQEACKEMYDFFGKKPVPNSLAMHWARAIENVYAAERCIELSQDAEISGKEFRVISKEKPSEGVGVVEAPRGTLVHHYKSDDEGLVKELNLIVPTTSNNAAINMDVKRAAQRLIKKGQINEGLLNQIEVAFRAYDPCLACATHTLPGQLPLEAIIRDSKGDVYKILRKNL